MEHNKKIIKYIFVSLLVFASVILGPHLIAQATIENTAPIEGLPFFIVAAIIGGLIIVTLTYVSWKKYKAEYTIKDKNKNEKENS